jgi:hypothetical protein
VTSSNLGQKGSGGLEQEKSEMITVGAEFGIEKEKE